MPDRPTYRPVYKALHRPLTIWGVDRRQFFLALLLGAATFNLFYSFLAGLLMFAGLYGRTREMAVRAAIGGSRGRIFRQLLTESVVLSLAGGAAGLVVGIIGIRALLAINTAELPRVGDAGALVVVDWRVLAFTMAVTLGTGLLFGVAPALLGSRGELTAALKDGGRSGSASQNWSRSVLVVGEMTLALVLLVGAALLIRSAVALARVDPGFDANGVLTMQTSMDGVPYRASANVERVVLNVKERLRTVTGVENATATCCVPLQDGFSLRFVIAGRPFDGSAHGSSGWRPTSAGYFEVFRIRLLRGRTFTDRDDAAAPPVAVINEAMARQFWPGSDPLNDHLTIGRRFVRQFANEPERQIIGIVSDTRDAGLNSAPSPMVFVPQAQLPDEVNTLSLSIQPVNWVVRTSVEPMTIARIVQEQIGQVTGLPVSEVQSMESIVAQSTSRQRFNLWLMTAFSGVALLLAAIGIYGLMAYSVAQRRREVAIRLTLGAQASDVRWMVVFQGMRLAIIGVVIGLGAAFALARFVGTMVYDVGVHDPFVFTAVPVVLALAALLAVLVPAVRASRVDPVVALTSE